MFYLVQRIKENNYIGKHFWADQESRFSLEYMGSAEFEFGAIPKATKVLLENCEKMSTDKFSFGGLNFVVAATDVRKIKPALIKWLDDLLQYKAYTKERPYQLTTHLDNIKRAADKENKMDKKSKDSIARNKEELDHIVHWDIDNNILFSIDTGVLERFLNEARAVKKSRLGK